MSHGVKDSKECIALITDTFPNLAKRILTELFTYLDHQKAPSIFEERLLNDVYDS